MTISNEQSLNRLSSQCIDNAKLLLLFLELTLNNS